jgi:8-hydroxy-5-deazaflavin:NADPH oxidoreductase
MKVGILGSGDVARSLATGFVSTGHEVRLGTGHPDDPKFRSWLGSAGPRVSAGSFREAAEFGEIVVVSTRGAAAVETVQAVGPGAFRGKVVIDTTNPLVPSATGPATMFVGGTDSLWERIQRALPDARVVKAFNMIGHAHMVHPTFPGGPPDMLIAGDDAEAKRTVTGILTSFGWPVVDIGGIDGARALEPLCVAWIRSAMALKSWDVAFRLLRK